MRLLNVRTRNFEEFFDNEIPPYTIFSHTWGKEEVSYNEYISTPFDHATGVYGSARHGFRKIELVCRQTELDNVEYTWLDTCCIDKRSSAELTEAINSMFNWYRYSEKCYAYLEDAACDHTASETAHLNDSPMDMIGHCRWFTRGWTLQELVAPATVEFYCGHWALLGSRVGQAETVEIITGIHSSILTGGCPGNELEEFTISERMGWAAARKTSRKEDIAYCLLGIFDVNMPLLYGEGAKAFVRLQKEIIAINPDTSIFVWNHLGLYEASLLLAPDPGRFWGSSGISCSSLGHGQESAVGHVLGNTGLQIQLRLTETAFPGYYLAELPGLWKDSLENGLYLWLQSKNPEMQSPVMYFVCSPERERWETASDYHHITSRGMYPRIATSVVIALEAPRETRSNDDDQKSPSILRSPSGRRVYLGRPHKIRFPASVLPVALEVHPPSVKVDKKGAEWTIDVQETRIDFAAVKFSLQEDVCRKLGNVKNQEVVIVFGLGTKLGRPKLFGIVGVPKNTNSWFATAANSAYNRHHSYFPWADDSLKATASHEMRIDRRLETGTIVIVVSLHEGVPPDHLKVPHLTPNQIARRLNPYRRHKG